MAGHRRTAPAWGTEPSGRARRTALPPDAVRRPLTRARRRQRPAELTRARLGAAADGRARLAVAVGYVRSAAAKTTRDAELDTAVAELLRIGDWLLERRNP